MQPKKVKQLLPGIAQQLYLPLEMVELVNKFFWDNTRKALADAPKMTVHIPNLGDFEIKHWKLQNELNSTMALLEKISSQEKPNSHVISSLHEKVEQLERLLSIKKAEDQRKEFIKEHKTKRTENVEANISAALEE